MRFAFLVEPPFNYYADDGSVTGHDVELARHVCRVLGTAFEPVETHFADLLPGLARGDWQLATGMFATTDRRKVAQFTRPIWALGDGLLVGEGNPLGLTGFRDIASTGATLAVLVGQEQGHIARDHGVCDANILEFQDYIEAAEAVRSGQAHAYASVHEAHTGFLQQHPDWPVATVPVPSIEKPYAFGCFSVAENSGALVEQINQVLEGYIGSDAHRAMAQVFGFSDAQIDRLDR